MSEETSGRIRSVDIMRGLTLLLMLFVNDLYVPGVPSWLTHKPANFDGMGLADWVFPGFLFMVGMSVPFAIQARIRSGDSLSCIFIHIFNRSVSLLLIGVFMYNSGRFNPDLTGLGRNSWAILMLLSVFLIWNQYNLSTNRWLGIILRILGLMGLIFLSWIFKSGTPENPGWMKPGWWGILGLIGWGYLAGALSSFFSRHNFFVLTLVTLFFLMLNVLSQLKLLGFLDVIKPVFGILIEGNVPFIVLAGVLTALILKKEHIRQVRKPIIISCLGIIFVILGFIFRRWFIISKILATPSWGLICTGISMMLFSIVYYFSDVRKKKMGLTFFEQAGKNSLTIYLAPDILYYLIWMFNLHILIYKQHSSPLLAVAGSLIWAIAMLWFGKLLNRLGIRLKL